MDPAGNRGRRQHLRLHRFEQPTRGKSIVARIDRVIMSLTAHPRLGRLARLAGSRELIVAGTPFIVAYRLRGRAVEVLGVIHAARSWPDRL